MSITTLLFSIITTIFVTIWTAIIVPLIKRKLYEVNIRISDEQINLLKEICLMAIKFVEEYVNKNKKSNPEFAISSKEKLTMATEFVKEHIKNTALKDKISDSLIQKTIEAILNTMR